MTETLLWYHSGSSDKIYRVKVVGKGPGTSPSYSVVAEFGRRGGTMQSSTKHTGLSFFAARAAMDVVVGEKVRKGYQVIPSDSVIADLTPGQPAVHATVMAKTPHGTVRVVQEPMAPKRNDPLRKPKRAINLDD